MRRSSLGLWTTLISTVAASCGESPIATEVRGLTVTPSALTLTEGSATPGTFSVRLTHRPDANVTVHAVSANVLAALTTPTALTFTPENFDTAQSVSITAVSDGDTDDEQLAIQLTAAGLRSASLEVRVEDDDAQALVASPTSLSLQEDGTALLSVRLTAQPSATTTVFVASSDNAKATPLPGALTFDATNFATTQTVVLHGVADLDTAHEAITLTLATGDGMAHATVSAIVMDDDEQALVLTPTTLGVVENASASFTVRLAFQPATDVTVTTATSATSIATAAPATLVFTRDNYDAPQSVTVTAPDDGNTVTDDTEITVTASTLASPAHVFVTVQDDDTQFVRTNAATLDLVEGAASGTLEVWLNLQPAVDTAVSVVSTNSLEVAVAPASLVFTPANFATPQVVTVTPATDVDATDEAETVQLGAAGMPTTGIAVHVDDDDTQQHVVTLAGGPSAAAPVVVREENVPDAAFAVHLSAQPVGNVTVTLEPSVSGVIALYPDSITFTQANYSTDVFVSLGGLSDPNLVDELVDVVIRSSAAASVVVPVLVEENDLQDLVVTPVDAVQPSLGTVQVREDASPAAYIDVRLQFQPEGTKGVRVSSGDPSVLVYGVPYVDLFFTTTNYAKPQRLYVTTPTDNNLHDPADTMLTIGLCETQCASAVFSAVKRVNIDAQEDDVQSLVTSTSVVGINENAGPTVAFTVHLAFEPLEWWHDELITLSPTSTDAALVYAQTPPLAFNSGNYGTPQAVIVEALQDADVLNELFQVSLSSNVPTTPMAAVEIRVTDDDVQAILMNEAGSTLGEGGASTTFWVTLQQDPSGTLVVDVVSKDADRVMVSPATLTFSSGNYAVAQPVTVNAMHDADVRNESIDIVLSAPGVMQNTVYAASVVDEDDQFIVGPASVVVNEEGSTNFSVHLGFAPTSALTITASVTDGSKATVSGPRTYTAGDFPFDQTFTVTGLADADAADVFTSLSLTVSSAQGNMPPEGAPTVLVSLQVNDND